MNWEEREAQLKRQMKKGKLPLASYSQRRTIVSHLILVLHHLSSNRFKQSILEQKRMKSRRKWPRQSQKRRESHWLQQHLAHLNCTSLRQNFSAILTHSEIKILSPLSRLVTRSSKPRLSRVEARSLNGMRRRRLISRILLMRWRWKCGMKTISQMISTALLQFHWLQSVCSVELISGMNFCMKVKMLEKSI